MSEYSPGPDELLFIRHLNGGSFMAGVDRGDWGVVDPTGVSTWPIVFLWISAASKNGCPDRYSFRFDLAGYPAKAPTAQPWDEKLGMPLPATQWPKGKGNVQCVFNPGWNASALYAPCDRRAMDGHDAWREVHPTLWWKPEFTIVKYVSFVHKLLHSEDYVNP